jgi:formylglycine-generating enzyme required for sulfatase activity
LDISPASGDKEALSKLAGTTAMEFGYACTQGGTTTYPYGSTFEPARCIDAQWVETKGKSSLSVTDLSNRACHGTTSPFDQIYDLSGSVGEWQNLCWLSPDFGSCLTIGGSAFSFDSWQACAGGVGFGDAHAKFAAGGFRCCADGVPVSAPKP